MRGGGTAVSGPEGKARLLVACTLLLQGHGWRSVCRARERPEGLKKILRVLHKECYNDILQLRSSLCNTVQNVRQSGL